MSQRLQQLRKSVEDSRSGVIDAHRALLELADSSVGRVRSQHPALLLRLLKMEYAPCHLQTAPGLPIALWVRQGTTMLSPA